ncbi:unnamed protein product [Natator depressus]
MNGSPISCSHTPLLRGSHALVSEVDHAFHDGVFPGFLLFPLQRNSVRGEEEKQTPHKPAPRPVTPRHPLPKPIPPAPSNASPPQNHPAASPSPPRGNPAAHVERPPRLGKPGAGHPRAEAAKPHSSRPRAWEQSAAAADHDSPSCSSPASYSAPRPDHFRRSPRSSPLTCPRGTITSGRRLGGGGSGSPRRPRARPGPRLKTASRRLRQEG